MNKSILAIGIVFLFVCSAFIPMSLGVNTSITDTIEQPTPFSRGKTLYVGGDGEGNYSKIQDAVDNASDGDTVFVYSGFYDYYSLDNLASVKIEKSINVIGEDRNTTIIDGKKRDDVVKIYADNVRISNFTIQNSGTSNKVGIQIKGNFNIISSNIIINNDFSGIHLQYSSNNQIIGNVIVNTSRWWEVGKGIILVYSDNNIISGNYIFLNDKDGIGLRESNNNLISGNIIEQNGWGIRLVESYKNNLTYNVFLKNDGITLGESSNRNMIYKNSFESNVDCGVDIYGFSFFNKVIKNNFMSLFYHAEISDSFFTTWEGNYWGRKRLLPKIILGSGSIEGIYFDIYYPYFNIDWHPAQEPYNISDDIISHINTYNR